MRVVKKLYSDDERTRTASRLFDEVIREVDLPHNFELLEFSVGYGFTHIEGRTASVGIEIEPWFDNNSMKTAITFEIYRIYVRKKLDRQVPNVIEDILVGRDMAHKYEKGLMNMFCAFIASQRVKVLNDYVRLNIPWIVFHGIDECNSEMLKAMAKETARAGYNLKSRKLFNALQKDLWIDSNLSKAIDAWESLKIIA